ncbi:maestro heat-like repeat-containing protein family member 7 [Chrysemys picta bellii]|uniref:maestro heat-like repeat-containing protein family member 7 n=1 Tax=Chrysemys picta bellii TaxID=8478 RepID=UPI0032B12A3C
MADLLLTVVESLKEANESTIEASKTILNVILEKYKQKIQMEVPKIVDRIHSQLRAIHHSHARQCSCVVKTVKTLLLKMGCHYEFTSVEKVGGWELLTSSEEHHRGVGLLARAMVHYSCCQLWRILYLLVLFLERGDKQHKLTAMAFFVELLHMPQAKRLPEQYSVLCLLKGLTDPDPVIRALCVKGLITVADWPGKEIKVLVPAMINSLCGMDGRLVVEALADVKKILRGLDVASYVGCITSPLRLLFDDVRQRCVLKKHIFHRKQALLVEKKIVLSKALIWTMEQHKHCSNFHYKPRGVLLFTIKTPVFLTSSVCVCLSQERMSVRSAAISLFGKMVKKVMKSQGLMKEEDVLDSLIPLPLHLQEGNPDMAEASSYSHLAPSLSHHYPQTSLSPSPPFSVGSSPNLSTLMWFLVMHMDNMMRMKDLDIISNGEFPINIFSFVSALGGLMHDPEASVCIFAAQARERVLAVYWKVKYGLVEQHKVNSDSAEKHKSPPNPPATESTSSRLFNALNLWKLAAKH